ncbi:MAG: L-serine ammonia-lyase [Acidobacteriota bacterium]|nr:L-serine ammonia-lyase [Acidobacteriota bacterium]
MALSVFDLFSIGIGPSSSHTVGPMRAAKQFVERLAAQGRLGETRRIRIELYGSLALTGKGHGTDRAVLLGLEGEAPETLDPDSVDGTLERIRSEGSVRLLGEQPLVFDETRDLLFLRRKSLPLHPNGMRFTAYSSAGSSDAASPAEDQVVEEPVVEERVYYSVGGGFVVTQQDAREDRLVRDTTAIPYPYASGADLLRLGAEHGLPIYRLVWHNELCWHSEEEIRSGLRTIWQAMQDCVARGCREPGVLPGSLKVPRRASKLYQELSSRPEEGMKDPLTVLDWVNLYALAVNEENAAGGRVVTAPTNGAAGILPAVLHYYTRFVPGADDEGVLRFLLTAGAIGILYKENASISGAEVGCQGEVGVACSMAAAGLVAAVGGTNEQVENAAEIGMEHNLGLTCDPVAGLVQIPCIERNAMGAVKAINAARIARRGQGGQKVSLDKVMRTMQQTGADMKTKYKETSRGGLAINVIEC